MSVCKPLGFVAGVASAGFRSDSSNDVAIVINQGPEFSAAAVFTKNQVKAAPVLWSQEAIKTGKCKAVVLNSGGANACTGSKGFGVAHETAEHLAKQLSVGAIEIQVCSTGLIGKQLDVDRLKPAIDKAVSSASRESGEAAAWAILTTDSHSKTTFVEGTSYSIGGMIKGAGMLAPDLATMLCVITTDAKIDSNVLSRILSNSVERTLNRIDSDGCTSTNDSVIIMSSGVRGECDLVEFEADLIKVLEKLGNELISDAEGSTKTIKITALNCLDEKMAVTAARAVARNNLFKAAMFGSDANWGRILAALGVIDYEFDQFLLDVYMNGNLVCKSGEALKLESQVNLSERLIEIEIDFHLGHHQATIWTNDLSEKYVYENSAYST